MKYKIFQQIGEGSFGKVYRAESLELDNKVVAIKVIHFKDQDGAFPLSSYREIRMLKGLSCIEGIIPLLDIFIHEGKVHLVFEYCPYDLSSIFIEQYKRNIIIPPLIIITIIRELLVILENLGKMNIIHRDIKASNILISSTFNVRLADFGLAKSANKNIFNNLTNRVVTIGYRSPELLFGETNYTQEVDVWAVGCLIYQFLSNGSLPFKGVDEFEQIEIMESYYSDWKNVLSGLPWYFESPNHGGRTNEGIKSLFLSSDCPLKNLLIKIANGMMLLDRKKRLSIKDSLSLIDDALVLECQIKEDNQTSKIVEDFIKGILPLDLHEYETKGLEN